LVMSEQRQGLISPYGGRLVNLLAAEEEREALRRRAASLPRVQLTPRNVCDLELLATGGFSPLDRFMGQSDYRSVLDDMRLADGTLYPMPVTLAVGEHAGIRAGIEIALADQFNNILAVMQVEEIYKWEREEETDLVYCTTDQRHPLVAEMYSWGRYYVSGPLRVIQLPRYYDFRDLRLTPAEVRARLAALGHANVVAFQTRHPLHRAHEELTVRAASSVGGALLLHPAVGLAKRGDIDHYARIRSYKASASHYYDPSRTVLALLPLALRMAGPVEALWHAIIRRNYGASHLLVGRDHASPGNDSEGRPFYRPHEAQELVAKHAAETGVKPLLYSDLVYVPDEDRFEEAARVPVSKRTVRISSREIREQYLQRGRSLPQWFTRPEVASILAEAHPPRHRQGFCIWFTGLSGAGKSTTADILTVKLLEYGRQVTVLDGDVVRTHLSKGLGFSAEDRDTNIRRIGFVASEIARHGGAVICAAVSPYRKARSEVRHMVGPDRFVMVYVDTPLEVCEQRDMKGLYVRARRGETTGVAGIDDPYEPPLAPDLTLTTTDCSPEENALRVLDHLIERGFILKDQSVAAGPTGKRASAAASGEYVF
jgi:sulfate adenylyltransferase